MALMELADRVRMVLVKPAPLLQATGDKCFGVVLAGDSPSRKHASLPSTIIITTTFRVAFTTALW